MKVLIEDEHKFVLIVQFKWVTLYFKEKSTLKMFSFLFACQ